MKKLVFAIFVFTFTACGNQKYTVESSEQKPKETLESKTGWVYNGPENGGFEPVVTAKQKDKKRKKVKLIEEQELNQN